MEIDNDGEGDEVDGDGDDDDEEQANVDSDVQTKGKARREPSPSPPPLDPLYDPEDDKEEEIQEEVREMEMEAGDFGEDELQDHSVGTSAGASAGAVSSSGTNKVYQRGPIRLPTKRPSCEENPIRDPPPVAVETDQKTHRHSRPLEESTRATVASPPVAVNIVPKKVIATGGPSAVAALLGVLLKDHFPAMVLVEGKEEPEVARTWAHYVAQPDFQDRENVVYANKAERVKGEFWRLFKLAEGHADATIERHFEASVKKALSEIFYHARVYAVRKYYAEVKKQRLEKAQCIVKHLEHVQYMQVPPHGCISHLNAWKALVDSWCSPEYVETHGLLRERRGKVSTVSECSANAPPEAYATPTDHAKVTGYTEVFEEVHGPGLILANTTWMWKWSTGGGKKHGRLVFGNGTIDPSTIPSLPHLKATSTSSSASIRSRLGARQFSQQEVEGMVAAQVQAQMEAQRQAQDAQIQAKVAAQVQAQMQAAWRAQYDHLRAAYSTTAV
ncbi:LOW QUALITY PROTEIN: hypothetical protein BRADI_3g28872v3 [Brachypodium distachyon]|uniref:Uncharacterized protein n=1 Tax=Brachypodium distachyon TaxID=15368 RepID=A0A2K2CZT9_BRADI|nr:LOW QUALITY PROTEIN: hypothetical protein BRADI_3g28872v3 [Brachypodium distachyon]